jgi:hypothetical protein
MTTCLNGHNNPDGQRFCGECGAEVERASEPACPNGHQNTDGQRFCGECGAQIERAREPKAAEGYFAERWQRRTSPNAARRSQSELPTINAKASSLPPWLIIVGIIAVIIAIYVVVEKPWESQQYKDCVSAGEREVNATTTNTHAGIESYCHELYG